MMGPRELWRRLRTIVRHRPVEDDLAEELEAHLDLSTRDHMARGLSEKAARRAALIDLGGVQQAKELHRRNRGLPIVEQLWHDIRLGVRGLRRDVPFTAFAVSIVALGVGASALVFSVASALLLRPLPFDDPERLVWVANGLSSNLSAQTLQVDNLLDLRAGSDTFSDMAAFNPFYGPGDIHLDDARGPQRITGVPITEGLLPLLGVEPVLGRGFTPHEVAARDAVTLLSHRLWRTRFDSDPEVIGTTLRLDGSPTTVVGVLPASFAFEHLFTPGRSADLFLPYALDARNNRRGNTLAVVGRLAPGATLSEADAELTTLAAAIRERSIERRNSVAPRLVPLHERISGKTRTSVRILGGAVALLMALVCANLSSLLLARATTRRHEMALHTALGAGRGRLVRKLLCESLLLSSLGTIAGIGLALFGARWLSRLDGAGIPLLHQVQIDAGVLLFAAGIAAASGALFGILPAFQASSMAPADAMRGDHRATDRVASTRARQALVAGELALACVLLVGVGLFARSWYAALSTELGYDTANIVALRVDLPLRDLDTGARLNRFDQLLAAVRALPEVADAGLTDALPLGDNFGWRTWTVRASHWTDDDDPISPLVRIVDGGYGQTMGLRLVAGRPILDSDRAQRPATGEKPSAGDRAVSDRVFGDRVSGDRVVVVNEALAARLWPEATSWNEVLSRTLVSSGRSYRVIGVAEETRYFSVERASGPELYFSMHQVPDMSSVDLVMRTRVDLADALPSIQRALSTAAPGLPVTEMRSMDQLMDRSTFRRRAVLGVLSGFGGFGLVLALLGVYSVIAYTAVQNRRALGVRMAFGATRRHLSRELVQRMLKPIVLGSAAGLLAAFWLARAAASQLYGVRPDDPLTYGIVALLLAGSGLVASYVPARRAAGQDVADVLRES